MTRELRLARRTTVAEAQDLLGIGPVLVPETEDLLAAMRFAGRAPATRIIGVTDAEGRLVGIVPVELLAEAVVAHAVPEAFFADTGDIADIGRFGQALEARTIGEIAEPPAAIAGDRTISDAFRQMHERELCGLYVVDAEHRPTGYLDLQELAMAYVNALGEARGSHPTRVEDVQDPPARDDA